MTVQPLPPTRVPRTGPGIANRLPIRIVPAPGEALDGYLERLSDANAMTRPALIADLRRHGGPTTFLTIAPGDGLVRRLSDLTGHQPPALRQLTLEGLPGNTRLTPLRLEGRSAWRQTAATGWAPPHGTPICPRCLDEDGTWQTIWRHPAAAVCLTHTCWLTAPCPTCGKSFRSHATPLRPIEVPAGECGNPLGHRGRNCRQVLTDLATRPAPPLTVASQERLQSAVHGTAQYVIGTHLPAADYLAELESLTVLLLHLSTQPAAQGLAPWCPDALAESHRSGGDSNARWGLAPPRDLVVRGAALAAADEILHQPNLAVAAEAAGPWLDCTPRRPDGQLGWLADHTRITPLLTRLIMAATSSRRRLSTLLTATTARPLPPEQISQLADVETYQRAFARLIHVSETTGRLFTSLCLTRYGRPGTTWASAATVLGLPADLGTTTAHLASSRLTCSPQQWLDEVVNHARHIDRDGQNYRLREQAVQRLAARRRWYRAWSRAHHPGSHTTSARYAITWLWTRHASAHPDTSPAWRQPPTAQERAYQRRYDQRLTPAAQQALRDLVAATR